MKLLRGFQQMTDLAQGVVATIGNFDGVHLGHQSLLKQLRQQSQQLRLPTLVILFEPQPCEFFFKKQAPARLTRLREKLIILQQSQIDYVYCLSFTEWLATLSAHDFVERIIFSLLHVKYILVGQDFRFGHHRQGDFALLSDLGYKRSIAVEACKTYLLENQRVSSTLIRQKLQMDQLTSATRLLGRQYSMCGRVIHGNGLGRQWGFPTANLKVYRDVLPLQGIFCVKIQRANGVFVMGVASLGCRPTVDGRKNCLEVYLFDFNESIYGEQIQVFFLHKLRDEVKFDTLEQLFAQIEVDVQMAKAFFKENLNE